MAKAGTVELVAWRPSAIDEKLRLAGCIRIRSVRLAGNREFAAWPQLACLGTMARSLSSEPE
jgi:hypothetical protein